ncbi:hypothetical protein G6F50_017710 [Rhizopus delemar]|uniref:Uncharacterized protein n=1 Tax=Rhizopus delemar TaxID=936053 RepID=A0A9P7BZU3_9FUNG|nr:hypothetical protein G6F50_017710 [Rhizopus delemar]
MPSTAVSTAPPRIAVANGASTNRKTVSSASTSPVMRATRSPLRYFANWRGVSRISAPNTVARRSASRRNVVEWPTTRSA